MLPLHPTLTTHAKCHKRQPPVTQLAVPVDMIERRIYLIRGQKVMLDSDLAEL